MYGRWLLQNPVAVVALQAVGTALLERQMKASLVQIDLTLLVRPGRTNWRMTAVLLAAVVSGLPICFTPIIQALFPFHSQLQIPQGNFSTIPATCLFRDSTQLSSDRLLRGLDLRCDLCVRASFENKRCDGPLFACQIRIPIQQRHHWNLRTVKIAKLRGRVATGLKSSLMPARIGLPRLKLGCPKNDL